jgi:hypothetical protein
VTSESNNGGVRVARCGGGGATASLVGGLSPTVVVALELGVGVVGGCGGAPR